MDLNCQINLLLLSSSTFRYPTQAKGSTTRVPVSPTWCAPATTTTSTGVPTTSKTWIFKRRLCYRVKNGAVDLNQYLIFTDCHLCTLCTITRCWDSIHLLQIKKKGRRKCTASAMCNRSHSRLQSRVTVSKVNKLRVSS